MAVSTLEASSITETSAQLNGLADGGSSDSQFQWRKSSSSTWIAEFYGYDVSGAYDVTIYGLDAGTNYEFRATYNSHSSYGDTLFFRTDSASAPVTRAATNVGETTATLNGTAEGGPLDSGFQWREGTSGAWTNVHYGWDISGNYSKVITGLTAATLYQFRATYNNYTVVGATLSFTTDIAATAYTEAVVGSMRPLGVLSTVFTHAAVLTNKAPSGLFTPTGALATEKFTAAVLNTQGVAGSMAPTGAVAVLKLPSFSNQAPAGSMTPTGALATTKIFAVNARVEGLAGSVAPVGSLSIKHTYVYVAGVDAGFAAELNMTIEQGATFTREFSWTDEDGAKVDIEGYDIRMAIKPYKGSSSVIASSEAGSILITKKTEIGYFEIKINADITAAFNFTRGVYDIEGQIGRQVFRLVGGSLQLSEEATT